MITVVIVNYNGREHLKECLESICASTYKDFRTVLVDNASRDGSVYFVRKNFPWVEVVQNDVNRGFAEGCNIGAAHSFGKYILFLNTDLRVEPSCLAELVSTAESDPYMGVCGGKILNMDTKLIDCIGGFNCDALGYGLSALGHLEEDLGQYDNITESFAIAGMTMLVSRKVFERVGGFDSKFFLLAEDIDLCWRTRLAGNSIKVNPRAIVYHKSMATFKKECFKRGSIRFLVERNTLRMLIKNYCTLSLIKIIPKYFAVLLSECNFYLLTGQVSLIVSNTKAILWNIKYFKDSWALHVSINVSLRSVSDQTIQKKLLKECLKIKIFCQTLFGHKFL